MSKNVNQSVIHDVSWRACNTFCRFVDAEYERNYILVMLFLALVHESC